MLGLQTDSLRLTVFVGSLPLAPHPRTPLMLAAASPPRIGRAVKKTVQWTVFRRGASDSEPAITLAKRVHNCRTLSAVAVAAAKTSVQRTTKLAEPRPPRLRGLSTARSTGGASRRSRQQHSIAQSAIPIQPAPPPTKEWEPHKENSHSMVIDDQQLATSGSARQHPPDANRQHRPCRTRPCWSCTHARHYSGCTDDTHSHRQWNPHTRRRPRPSNQA